MYHPSINFKKLPVFLYSLMISLVLTGCSAIDIFKENSEIAPRKDYESFVIVNQEIGIRGFSSQFLDQNVQIRLKENLENAGMLYEKNRPDVVIRYTSNEDPRQKEIRPNPYPTRFWGNRIYDPWMFNPYGPMMDDFQVRIDNYELVQVIVDFIDPEEDKFLMTLTGVTEVGSQTTKEKKVLKTVDKIVERFIQEVNQNPK
ncbi:DUF4136 domain-containing protein [Algoriphagus sediminis]|uniref:DUF4136 domain-containing protein n=1 Tax=Algoriphagus sediminis TaxID=3057113 RepID=A0ABT7YB42_9BACT|nr:DUF4136 domain-containing protein [Algoriphagus sediminis]MDN3203713.1 DUF4136 domain-containing protein [Algoriphagus sediminis]